MTDDNNLSLGDKFAKIRPLFTLMNENFIRNAYKFENHSVEEAMVLYFGRHGCKQFIRGKSIRWGYKLWVGCSTNDYINWFEPSPGYKEVVHALGLCFVI